MNHTDVRTIDLQILSTGVRLEGVVSIPEASHGMVLFVHGSGSNRHSPRNQFVAESLQESGFVTVLFDLLTEEEQRYDQLTRHLRFEINLLARRTAGVLEWLNLQPYAYGLRTGLFGGGTGAAAALMAAAELPERVDALVSRGGRPDLVGEALSQVQAPTLLIVGAYDEAVIVLNEEAFDQMQPGAEKKLTIVPGATHLFQETGTLEYVAQLSSDWFEQHLERVKAN